MADLADNPRVEHVQPNYRYTYYNTGTDDTLGDSLWALDNTSDRDIDAPEAWAISEGQDVIIAVIDSGVAYNHPDLIGNMWDGSACVDELGIFF